jgi:hypothetical protein
MSFFLFIKDRKYIGQVFIVFALALLLRIAVLLFLMHHGGENQLVLGDSGRYLALAQSVVSGHGYQYDGFVESYRAPGYPLYLMVILWLHLRLVVASLLQIVLSSFIPVILYYIGVRFTSFTKKIIFSASVLAAIEPVQVFYSVPLLADAFFGLFFVLMIWVLLYWLERPSYKSAILAGVLLGLMNYERPAGIYFGFFLAVGLSICLLLLKTFKKKRGVELALFFAFSFLVILPWNLRNYHDFGAFSFVSSSAYTFYAYGAITPLAIDEHRNYNDVKKELMAKLIAEAPGKDNVTSFKNKDYLVGHTVAIIKDHPVAYIKAYFLGINTFLFSGNYHYLLMNYGLLNRPDQIISFSLVLAQQGIGGLADAVMSRLTTPYYVVAILGKILWIIITLGSFAGAYLYWRTSLGMLYILSLAYFSATILAVTIGVEARHRYMLNPFIFLFFIAFVYAMYCKFFLKVSVKV